MRHTTFSKLQIVSLFLLVVASGCAQTSNLAQFSFEGKRVAVVSEIPDAPFADFDMTIFDKVGQDLPIANNQPPGRDIPPLVIEKMRTKDKAPGPVSPVHVLIDSVLIDFNMSDRIVRATHNRSASLMRFEPVGEHDGADYLLEVIVDDYGIGSDAWESTAYFEVMGQLRLVDNVTRKLVWEGDVMDVVPLTKALLSVGIPGDDKETPAALSKLPVEEMKEVLSGLAAYASIQLVAPLREAYNKKNDRESAHFEKQYMARLQASPSSQRDL